VSWLALEQLAAGELGEGEGRVREHLAGCDACRACLAKIEADAEAPLPPLRTADSGRRAADGGRRTVARPLPWLGGALALAAALLLYVKTRPDEPRVDRTKGSTVSITVIREGGAGEAGVFGPNDRFKVLVSCPPSLVASWDLAVYDDGGAQFPLAPVPTLVCGNAVPIPGAFRLSGDKDLHVCAVWSEDGPVDRAVLGPTDLANRKKKACEVLRPGR
jgi:hypothetical protein